MPERVLLLGDDLRAFLAIARSLGRRLRQMSPDFTAEVVNLADLGAGTESFPDIAAALERLASVVEVSVRPEPHPPLLSGAAAAAA